MSPRIGPPSVIVVGGGIAGLVAAWELQQAGVAVTVLEASESFGGIVGTAELGGHRVDVGAESFATRGGHVAALLGELGLGGAVVAPRPLGSWLQLPERAVPMPALSLHGIPSTPLASDVIRVLGWRGAFRAWFDRLLPVGNPREESLSALVERRMGIRVVERLLRPVFGGIRSISPDEVTVTAAIPGLTAAMTRAGSLSGAVLELRAQSAPGSQVAGLAGGLGRLVRTLVEALGSGGAELRTGGRVDGLRKDDLGWQVSVAGGEPVRAAGLLVAVDAAGLERLLPLLEEAREPVGTEGTRVPDAPAAGEGDATDPAESTRPADEAGPVDEAGDVASGDVDSGNPDSGNPSFRLPVSEPVTLVTLLLRAPALDAAPRGTGLLVGADPRIRSAAKALTHSSAKWEWWSSSLGEGEHLVRLSYRTPPAEGEALADAALAEASRLLGVDLPRTALLDWHRQDWRMPVLQETPGLLPALALPAFQLTGSVVAGTGLAATVPHARAAARRLAGGPGRS